VPASPGAGPAPPLFGVQGISRVLREPEEVGRHERAYDALLHRDDCPGMFWNLYLKGLDDPQSSIHMQVWASQRHSEEFGVSPGFQAMRQELSTAPGPRGLMVGPLSPGYWRPLYEQVLEAEPTGCELDGDELGLALHGLTFVRPGSEHAYVDAEREVAAAFAASGGIYAMRCLQNLGHPGAFTWVRHARDPEALDAALARAREAEERRAGLASEETVARYRVWLLSTWPERRGAAS